MNTIPSRSHRTSQKLTTNANGRVGISNLNTKSGGKKPVVAANQVERRGSAKGERNEKDNAKKEEEEKKEGKAKYYNESYTY